MAHVPQPQTTHADTALDHGYPVHRSRLALARNANVFVWWPSETAKVIACYNADVTPITAQTLLRWIGMPTAPHDDDNEEVVVIKRVELVHQDVFLYDVRPLETLISSDVVVPGIYGCFVEGDPPRAPSKSRPIWPYNRVRTLERNETLELQVLERDFDDPEEWPALKDKIIKNRSIPDHFREQITIPRDKCVFTGTSTNPATPETVVDLAWIFPPHLCDMNLNQSFGIRRVEILTAALAYSPENVLPVRADVHKLWMANEIGVDVDDGYRIHRFTDTAARMESLRLTLDSPNTAWDPFLREHLLQTVLLRVNGGNIMEDFGVHGWLAKKEQLAEGNLQDEVWREPIGQDAFRLLYPDGLLLPTSRSSSSLGASESDSEDAEDDDSEDSEDGDSEDD